MAVSSSATSEMANLSLAMPPVPGSFSQFLEPSLMQGFALSVVVYAAGAFFAKTLMGHGKGTAAGPSSTVLLVTLLFAVAAYTNDFNTPVLEHLQDSPKRYLDFSTFYLRYNAEHQVPADRVLHVLLFLVVTASMAWNPKHLVPWVLSLTAGALLTRPLLCVATPWLEASVVSMLAGGIAGIYGSEKSFFVKYSLWTMSDLTSHVYLGSNGPIALFIGEHYLAWGLWGQARLVSGIVQESLGLGTPALVVLVLASWKLLSVMRWTVAPPTSPLYHAPAKAGDATVFITGCASGLGRQLAIRFLAAGYNVVATDLNVKGLQELAASQASSEPDPGPDQVPDQPLDQPSKRLMVHALDVTRASDWAAVYAKATHKFGRIDVHINNAGYLKVGDAIHDGEKEINLHVDVNIKGVMFGSSTAAQHMLKNGSGHIINIGSLASLTCSGGGLEIYSSTKFAVRAYTLALHVELRQQSQGKVAVSLICPDAIATPMLTIQKDKPSAALTFSGTVLTPDRLCDTVLHTVLPARLVEVWVPFHRGFLAKLEDLIGTENPALNSLKSVLMAVGRSRQATTPNY